MIFGYFKDEESHCDADLSRTAPGTLRQLAYVWISSLRQKMMDQSTGKSPHRLTGRDIPNKTWAGVHITGRGSYRKCEVVFRSTRSSMCVVLTLILTYQMGGLYPTHLWNGTHRANNSSMQLPRTISVLVIRKWQKRKMNFGDVNL